MTTSSTPGFEEPKEENKELPGMSRGSGDLLNDPDFVKLTELYQQGDFGQCKTLADELEKKFPDDPKLQKFKQDIEEKLSLKTLAVSSHKEQTRTKRKISLRLSIFAIIGTIIVIAVFLFSFYNQNKTVVEQEMVAQRAQLNSLTNQAAQLLLSGQPQPAITIIEKIKSIDPNYEYLPVLTSRADDLLRLETKYNKALDLISQNKPMDALVLLREIEAEKPGMWDVSQRIKSLESSIDITQFLQLGNAAYLVGNWDQVIDAYEDALNIDPKLNDPMLREQLVQSYLNKIISMLQSEGTSSATIDKAQEYYRKAITMTAQDKNFTAERENLQKVSGDLLQLKFVQIAKSLLEDKKQTVLTLSDAVRYLSSALEITPENTTLQSDKKNAQLYLAAFQNFLQMNWGPAITNLTQILATDSTFAGGNAKVLLYEAYYGLGKQYYSAGVFADARTNLEQAEIIAWDDPANKLKLFQVQVLLGDTIGQMGDFKNANSYYLYALESAKIMTKLANFPGISTLLSEASNYASEDNQEKAYTKYKDAMAQIDSIYSKNEKEISSGTCLALFAAENFSTLDAVIKANNLPQNMVIEFGQTLVVPFLENN